MIARALRTKFQVICARSKENVSVFRYFIASTRAQNAKLTMNFLAFSSVKFRETWQTGSKCFTLDGARFSGKSIRPGNIEKPAYTNPTFSCLKFVSRWMRCAVKILEDFTEGNSRLSQIKPETRCTESTHDLERKIEKAHPNLFSSQIITLPLPHVSLFANEKKNLLCAVA